MKELFRKDKDLYETCKSKIIGVVNNLNGVNPAEDGKAVSEAWKEMQAQIEDKSSTFEDSKIEFVSSGEPEETMADSSSVIKATDTDSSKVGKSSTSEDSKVELVPEKKSEGSEAASIEKGPEVVPVVRTISKERIKKLYYESIKNYPAGPKSRLKRTFDNIYKKDSYTEKEIQDDIFLKQNKLVDEILKAKG